MARSRRKRSRAKARGGRAGVAHRPKEGAGQHKGQSNGDTAVEERKSGRPLTKEAVQEARRLAKKRRAQEREDRVRDRLEPLPEGERPGAVTVAAVVAVVLAIANLVAFVTGTDLGGSGNVVTGIVWPALLLVAAAGMWRARYWAVLGFEAMLALQIVPLAVALAIAGNPLQFAAIAVIVIAGGVLFWKLIKAMARIQMPDRPARRS